MPDVSYVPGALIAVAGERCLALVEATPHSAVTTWIWQRVGQGTPAEALLAGLLGADFEGVGGFALLANLADRAAGQRRLFCRGAVAATVEGGNVSARIDGVGLLTWREYVIASDAERVVLGEQPDDKVVRLPAATGVLLANCIVIDLTSAASRDTIRYDSPVGGYSSGAYASGKSDVVASASDRSRGRRVADLQGDDSRYDLFWGPVMPRSFEEAAMGPASSGPASSEPASLGSGSPGPALAGPGSPGGLIDAVQWGPGPGAAAGPSAHQATAPSAGAPLLASGPGESEFTVKRADLPAPAEAEQAARSATAPDWVGPAVPALICLAGHANPPSEAVCRQCAAALPTDVVVVPRPVLGVLRLSTGDVVTLDRGVVMGRDPRANFAGADGEERPHVVKLPSADGDISRTHVRVTLDGWHVLVTDLKSTNGTLVTLPGRDPEQLRPDEPVPIRPGTVVTLADGIDFRYEVAE